MASLFPSEDCFTIFDFFNPGNPDVSDTSAAIPVARKAHTIVTDNHIILALSGKDKTTDSPFCCVLTPNTLPPISLSKLAH
jgi:hypothetical protein